MSRSHPSFAISTPDSRIDPCDHPTASSFKAAVYDAGGFGSWFQDLKLQAIWLIANDEPIPDELAPIVPDTYLTTTHA